MHCHRNPGAVIHSVVFTASRRAHDLDCRAVENVFPLRQNVGNGAALPCGCALSAPPCGPPFELGLMFTIYEEIESGWAKAYENIRLSEDERGSFTEFISDEEGQARTKAIVDLQPWLAIFELGIEWLSYVHVALTNDLERKSGDSRYRATWALVGSAVSLVYQFGCCASRGSTRLLRRYCAVTPKRFCFAWPCWTTSRWPQLL